MNDVRLTAHFNLSEFTYSQRALELGLDNQPHGEQLANLVMLAHRLEDVRALLNAPILITSGFRSVELNNAVGGVASSDHTKGLAADFVSPGFGDVVDICRTLEDNLIVFDQLIFEQHCQGGTVKQWVHLGMGVRMRQQVLSWSPKSEFVAGVKVL